MPIIFHKTPLGFARITTEGDVVTALSIFDEAEENSGELNDAASIAMQQLDEYFAGTRKQFDFPYLQTGTEFQQRVWKELEQIEYGSTITYGQQSLRMNDPLAIRAIASANGKNKMWLVVPCHRVIGASGKLTGYAGGLWRKKWLLEHEAKVLGVGQASLF